MKIRKIDIVIWIMLAIVICLNIASWIVQSKSKKDIALIETVLYGDSTMYWITPIEQSVGIDTSSQRQVTRFASDY